MTQSIDAGTAVDLSTTYMGLSLRTPLVASPGPLTGRLEPLQALEDNGIAAVVLPSLFEEQVAHEELEAHALFELGADANPEATSYFPDLQGYTSIGERYLRHVRDARDMLSVPVIGSLNGVTPGGWVSYAARIADAGADALELNLYEVVADVEATADQIESAQLTLVEQVRDSISIPLAVKVGPYYTAFAGMARRLVDAGADALVLFNRFYQPDIDPRTLQVRPWLELSRRAEIRLPLRWTAILSGQVDASLALTGGVHHADDVARGLLAGADVTMMTSVLIDQGPLHVGMVEADLTTWISEMGYASVAELKGSVSMRTVADPSAFERANYIETLVNYTNTFHDGWGFDPF
jgi:dihydroorotate dehydrogenase (fumarate)